MFSSKCMDFDLFSWISEYFFICHSLLNQWHQNRQTLELAWWSPWQFKHLNVWGQGSPFFVSSLGRLILSFGLQHHLNSLWFSDLWGPLHLTHFEPWILHEKVACPHFQQFLHWETLGFMFTPQMVMMYFPTLKHRLMSILALLPLWTSHMLTHTMNILDLGDTLMIRGLKASEMLSKIWFCFRIILMSFEVRHSCELIWG